MLHLGNIRKTYHAGGFDQAALDGVTITFRDSEFVAVLGPSGSGKTTLLNIVGGLDHYDSGDLVIDSISTKQYSDRDWDAYRNNRIGFVFQSYNLIPHQTVLANVELALTLSGVSRAEREQRATEALTTVGLLDHIHKLPSQLSGGQMQRVAIARALINDPEILLADEPTGALDSKTSVAVMALLKDISRDRLVVMVTHNPDLADEYATRTVSLRDGVVTDDTDPYQAPAEGRGAKPARRTAMSFFTAISLSFKNLLTKKGRTLMTSFAGSIGIVGIATILALANGVNVYIRGVEEDTLSLYPLSISSQGIDLTTMLAGAAGMGVDGGEDPENEVHELKMVATMFDRIGNNDLAALKSYLDSPESGIDEHVNAIQYSYPVVPQIYATETKTIRQVNPNHAFSSLGISSDVSSSSLVSMGMSMDVFSSLPDNLDLVKEQYTTVAGRWPESYDECLLVLTGSGGVSDLVLYSMGLRDPEELDAMVQSIAANKPMNAPIDEATYTYEEIMEVDFALVEASDYYQWDSTYSLWTDMRNDENYMRGLILDGTPLHVVGVVTPDPEASANMLNQGLYYPSSLVHHLMDEAASSEVVKQQLANPELNVLTGKTFAEEAANPGLADFDLSSLITVNEAAIADLFSMDMSGFRPNLNLDLTSITGSMPSVPPPDLTTMLSGLDIQVDSSALTTVMGQILASYLQDIFDFDIDASDGSSDLPTSLPTDPSELPTAWPSNIPSPSDPTQFPSTDQIIESFSLWLAQPEVQAEVMASLGAAFNADEVQTQLSAALAGYMQQTMTTMLTAMMTNMQAQIELALRSTMSQLTSYMSQAMNIDPEQFRDIFQFNMDQEQLTTLLMSLMNTSTHTQGSNLQQMGYATESSPSNIDIYPKDFVSKQAILDILDGYNEDMTSSKQDDKVIIYTDIVGTLMTSVTDIIDKISAVLVAFVSISLVVSSIMIGVITYISVLERKKEIGILRALGASKRDIGNVFNAETLIVGFIAGVMGILITVALTLIANPIVYNLTDVVGIARLPWNAGVALIVISMVLTFIAGLIPSSAASRRDPVEALRAE